jgi:hypothetical protein
MIGAGPTVRRDLADIEPEPEPEKEKKKGADAPPAYAFSGEVIRLNRRDFDLWRDNFPALDLGAELAAHDAYLSGQPDGRRNWYTRTANQLRNRNEKVRQGEANKQFLREMDEDIPL